MGGRAFVLQIDQRIAAGTHIPLPLDLQWGTTYHLKAAPQRIKDEFGRRLTEAIDIQFTTAHRPPALVVRHPISVLEQQVETHMPLEEVLNLEAVHVQYETLTTKGRLAEQEITIPLQTETDLAYRIPLKVRETHSCRLRRHPGEDPDDSYG